MLNSNPILELAQETLHRSKQALIFVNSKKSAEKTAEDIAKCLPDTNRYAEISENLGNALTRPTTQCKRLSFCAKKGIVFHHAGLMSKQRELIEDSFRNNEIKIICATPTLAMGLDLPAFRAIIKDIKRYGDNGMDFIPVMEYHQMCGRAGRPGKEEYGEAIVITTKKEKEQIIEDFIKGKPEEIVSKLAVEPVLRTYLLSLIATEFVKNKKEIYSFFEKTFWAKQFKDMNKLRKIIEKMLNELEESEFIKIGGKEKKERISGFVSAIELDEAHSSKNDSKNEIKSTVIGKRVAELYIDPITANKLIKDIKISSKRKLNDFTTLFSICSCIEMKPILRVNTKEFEKYNLMIEDSLKYIIDKVPDVWDDEYADYLSVFKTSCVLKDWMDEKDEEYILEKYQIRPGELHFKITNGDWLLYSAENLALLIDGKKMSKEISKLRYRLKYGVKEELMSLLKLESVGRIRARSLFNAGYKKLTDLKEGDANNIARIVGKKIALNIKKQLGEDINESSVKNIEIEEKKTIKKEQRTLNEF